MPELTADRFDEFLAAVHEDEKRKDKKRTAFPWQQQLLEEVLSRRKEEAPWPTAIDAPTGLGKTSVLDVAVFATAAGLPLRRILFVVDRRIVVDEAYDHAQRLQTRVTPEADGILGEVGAKLAELTGAAPGPAIRATRMRGGITWDWRWMDRPDRFGIVVGTVDQVGSRLLFRGYGLSHRLAPIDAALVGADSVLFVDEAHLAEPMIRTIAAAQRLDQPEHRVCRPVSAVQLSATPRGRETLPFDVAAHLADPDSEAARRLRAAKTLHTVVTTEKASASVLAASALAATQLRSDALVGVVANTVAKARAVFDQVRTADGVATVLLTGRQRPWDRDRLISEWSRRVTVGWRDQEQWQPTVVVATQCIEVGANLDLDVLVTESAPWDSLVQRLGRVNRVGAVSSMAPVLVVHAEGVNADPVYGEPRTATWDWLTGFVPPRTWKAERAAAAGFTELLGLPGLDVSPLALRGLRPPADARSRPQPAPILFPQHLEGWVRTGPVPIPDAPVAPFLHGFDDRRPAVRVIWRADLAEPDPDGEVHTGAWEEAVATIPPRAGEELELPLAAVRAWLRHQPPIPLADDELPVRVDDGAKRTEQQQQRPAVRIGRRDEKPEIIQPWQLRPDDRIVVPAAYGGLDEFGWAPASTTPVLDIADVVTRRRPVIRLNRNTLLPVVRHVLDQDHARQVEALLDALELEIPSNDALDDLPSDVPQDHPATEDPLTAVLVDLVKAVTLLLGVDQITPRRLTARSRPANRPAARLLLTAVGGRRATDSTAAGSSVSERPVLLAAHHDEVGALAAHFARQLDLPDKLIYSLRKAAEWHDLGKLDPRFQTILFTGVALDAEAALLADEPRAKSGIDPADRRARRVARRDSDYPRDGRHEALSAALVRYQLARTDTTSLDAELVEHLVAAHHGHSRPLLPPVADENRPREVRVPDWDLTVPLPDDYGIDWASPRRFRRLCDRYGIWGLALLEAIVRLADIACSAGEYCEQAR
ncbi:MAG: type I-G CRISPR-associated helicase/endonuclease Cas3g [Pseudonocardiaceae bacterium]